MTVSKGTIFDIIYKTMIFLAVFDSIRHYSIISSYITRIKEVLVIALFVSALHLKKYFLDKKFFNIPMILFFSYLILILPITVYLNTPIYHMFNLEGDNIHYGYAIYYKIFQFIFILIIFYSYEDITKKKYEKLIKFFINATIIFILFNIVAYFVHLPIMDKFRPFPERISSGYPTMDAQMIAVALLANLYIVIHNSIFKKMVKSFILMFGLIMQATGTGIVSFITLIFFYIIFNRKYDKDIRRSNDYTIISAFFLIVVLVLFLNFFYYEYISMTINIFIRKFLFLILGFSTEYDVSLMVRASQLEEVLAQQTNWFDKIFGIGTFLGSNIENQFNLIRASFGIIGLLLFIVLFIYFIAFSLRNFDENGKILFLTIVLFGFTSYTLLTLYLITIEISYSLIFIYCILKINKKKEFLNYSLLKKELGFNTN